MVVVVHGCASGGSGCERNFTPHACLFFSPDANNGEMQPKKNESKFLSNLKVKKIITISLTNSNRGYWLKELSIWSQFHKI